MQEYAQTVPNLTEAAENLFTLVRGRNIALYPDQQLRLAFSRAVAIESARGWRIGKERQVHKIDVVVATAMAALSCVRGQARGRMRMASVHQAAPTFR